LNHKLIVISQLKAQATKLEAELAGIKTAIAALGGTVTSTPARGTRKAKAKGSGGWPKGKLRGPRKAAVAPPVATAPAPSASANPGADDPRLVAELKKISDNPDLSPIQKALASKNCRRNFRAAQEQGASLGAAAS
jgi:hypothetical protein